MKTKKVKVKFFSIVQWKQEFLKQQHKNGWKFKKVNFLGLYHFEKCEPEEVVYQLDFNPDGIANKDEYVQMFRDCGWEYLQDYVGYSYFRKQASEMNGDEEIFCDDSSRLDFMKRVFKGRIIPLIILFFFVIIPQLFIQFNLNSLFSKILTEVYVVTFIAYLILFLQFAIQYWKYKKSLE